MTNLNLITNILGIVGSILTIITGIQAFYSQQKSGSTNYYGCNIDNRSINMIQMQQSVAYVPSKPSFFDNMVNGFSIGLYFLLMLFLHHYLETFYLAVAFLCIGTFLLLLYFYQRNRKAGINQLAELCLYLISYFFCFAALITVDLSLTLNLTSFAHLFESFQVLFTIFGMFFILLGLFNPFRKSGKAFIRGISKEYTLKESALFISPTVVAFLFCSGVMNKFVYWFSQLPPSL